MGVAGVVKSNRRQEGAVLTEGSGISCIAIGPEILGRLASGPQKCLCWTWEDLVRWRCTVVNVRRGSGTCKIEIQLRGCFS